MCSIQYSVDGLWQLGQKSQLAFLAIFLILLNCKIQIRQNSTIIYTKKDIQNSKYGVVEICFYSMLLS